MNYLPPPSSLPPHSIVDCYIRDSGGDRQDGSTTQQLAEIQTYCTQHNLTLRTAYTDEARSGGTTAGRDAFNTMIDHYRAPANRPAALLLWNYARFARDLDDAIYYKALLRNRNITVHSLTDPIPEGAYGRIIEFFIDISNEEKRRQTSTDAKRGLRDLVLKHGCVPGTPPRGFMRQPVIIGTRRNGASHTAHRWVPDPNLVPRLKLAFQLKAEGATLQEIHAKTQLYKGINGYKTLFTNPLLIGTLQFSDLTIPNYCPPVIDLPTWHAVQKRLEAHAQTKRDRHHPRRANSPYLLSGLLHCAACGSPLSANTVTKTPVGAVGAQHAVPPAVPRNEAYRCSRSKRRAGCTQGRIGRKKLEDAVLHTLTQYILLPEILGEMLAIETRSTDRLLQQKDTQLAALSDTKKKLASQIANLTRAIAEKGHSTALLDRLTDLETQRAQLNTEIRQLENLHIAKTEPLTKEQIVALSATLRQKLTLRLPEQTRPILLSLIHDIRVQKNDQGQVIGTITYYLPSTTPPPFSEHSEANGGGQGGGPPFSNPLPDSPGTGYNLPIDQAPLGAQLYRQTYTHPIVCPPKRPR